MTWKSFPEPSPPAKLRLYGTVAGLTIAGLITPDGNPLSLSLIFLPLYALLELGVRLYRWQKG